MENIRTRERWMDWVNLVLGIWLFGMPFFGYMPLNSSAAVNGYLFGSVLTVISVAALVREQSWEEWLNFAIGLWLLAAPFVLGFTHLSFALWNSVIIGLFIVADALWAAMTLPREPGKRHRHHPTHA